MTHVFVSNPAALGPAAAPYSQATSANGFVFISGQVGFDEDGAVVAPGDVRRQTEVAIERMRTVLAEHDLDLDRIVTTTVFLTNPDDFTEFNEVWAQKFGDHRPARATVVAGLLADGLVVEIQSVAAL